MLCALTHELLALLGLRYVGLQMSVSSSIWGHTITTTQHLPQEIETFFFFFFCPSPIQVPDVSFPRVCLCVCVCVCVCERERGRERKHGCGCGCAGVSLVRGGTSGHNSSKRYPICPLTFVPLDPSLVACCIPPVQHWAWESSGWTMGEPSLDSQQEILRTIGTTTQRTNAKPHAAVSSACLEEMPKKKKKSLCDIKWLLCLCVSDGKSKTRVNVYVLPSVPRPAESLPLQTSPPLTRTGMTARYRRWHCALVLVQALLLSPKIFFFELRFWPTGSFPVNCKLLVVPNFCGSKINWMHTKTILQTIPTTLGVFSFSAGSDPGTQAWIWDDWCEGFWPISWIPTHDTSLAQAQHNTLV